MIGRLSSTLRIVSLLDFVQNHYNSSDTGLDWILPVTQYSLMFEYVKLINVNANLKRMTDYTSPETKTQHSSYYCSFHIVLLKP